MKKNKISCLAILFAALFVFAGCGSAKYTENSSCDTAASEAAPAESAGYYDKNAWLNEKGEMEEVENVSEGASDLGTKSEEVEHAGRKLIKRYNSDSARQCNPTEHADASGVVNSSDGLCSWWLRSPGGDQDSAATVYNNGDVFMYGYSGIFDNGAVRPALWIDLNS